MSRRASPELGEMGALPEGEKNFYWDIKLRSRHFLIGGSGAVYRWVWRIPTLFMIAPLYLYARRYARKLGASMRGDEKDWTGHRPFTAIYPGCAYSPLSKGCELELFRASQFHDPILEIAIGDGYFSSLLFESIGRKLRWGADLIYGTVKSAMRYKHCERFVLMDASEIPLPDGSVGTVVMNNLIHHVPSRELVLRESMRVLRTGGTFLLTDNLSKWGDATWEQRLLRAFHFGAVADVVLKYKLRLFAQTLLIDESFYDKRAKEFGYVVKRKVPFFSAEAMRIASVFEFLTLKQGQPTRDESRMWMRLFGIEEALKTSMDVVIRGLHANDAAWVEQGGAAFLFLELEKTAECKPVDQESAYVCPKCKHDMAMSADRYNCSRCGIDYPVVDGLPVLISYLERLKEFQSYVDRKKDMVTPPFST